MQSIFAAAFIFLVISAALSDYKSLRIPNWVSVALLGLFAVHAPTLGTLPEVFSHVAAGAIVLAGAAFMYAHGWLGGGDVKLLGALATWAGFDQVLEFTALTGLIGALLGAALIGLQRITFYYPAISWPAIFERPLGWAKQGVCPYGLAISAAALICLPKVFL